MASVVLAFTIATVVTEHYERAVADRAEDMIGNAMPSVQMLSSARGSLRTLENAVVPLPKDLPAPRAVLANMETALNAVWDAAPSAGEQST